MFISVNCGLGDGIIHVSEAMATDTAILVTTWPFKQSLRLLYDSGHFDYQSLTPKLYRDVFNLTALYTWHGNNLTQCITTKLDRPIIVCIAHLWHDS